jgi:CheY-like chemotaxis protein
MTPQTTPTGPQELVPVEGMLEAPVIYFEVCPTIGGHHGIISVLLAASLAEPAPDARVKSRLKAVAGFDVLQAADADEAIEILEDRTDIRVTFTDIQMPGSMDGLRLAHAVRGRWPPIKIVTTSGRVNVRIDDLPEGGRFLPKPYDPGEIARTLRELVGNV